jgi:hypothetical protein
LNRLLVDHIGEHLLISSKELLTDQVKVCLLRNFAGPPDPAVTDNDRHTWILDDKDTSVDLSIKFWSHGAGAGALEQYLAGRLFVTLLSSLLSEDYDRRIPSRFELPIELQTPAEIQQWPDKLAEHEPTWNGLLLGSWMGGRNFVSDVWKEVGPDPNECTASPSL